MTQASIRVGVISGTVWGNRGAEAMLASTVGSVRAIWPRATFRIFSYYPAQDRRLIVDESVEVVDARPIALALLHFPFAFLCYLLRAVRIRAPDRFLPKETRELRSCDVLLDIPGITFADGREKFLPFNILTLWPAMMLGVPVVKLAQAIGPFRNPLNRFLARRFLPRCARVFARGPLTAQHLESLQKTNIPWDLAADTAFLFHPSHRFGNENPERVHEIEARLSTIRANSKTVIAISPSSLVLAQSKRRGQDYIGAVAQVIRNISREEPTTGFLIVPNATREGFDEARNNDLVAVEELRNRLTGEGSEEEGERIAWVDFDLNTASIRGLLESCDVLLTSRFHAMIAALCLSLPTVVLGWSHKYEEVLSQFGLAQYAFSFEEENVDLTDRVRDILRDRDRVRVQIEKEWHKVRDLAQRQFDELEGLLR